MRRILFLIFMMFGWTAWAGGQIPFLFMPVPTLPPLYWNQTYLQFDGFGAGGYTQTLTLRNRGSVTTGSLTIALTTNGTAFSISNDTCSASILLPGGSCTVDISFNGFATSIDEMLSATDGTRTAAPVTIHNCSGC